MNLTEIRNMVRGFINEPDPSATLSQGFWPDSEINAHINTANAKINGLISSFDSTFTNVVQTSFLTEAPSLLFPQGRKTYELPSDMRTLIRVELVTTDGCVTKLTNSKFPRQEAYGEEIPTAMGQPCHYLWRGKNIDFIPTPDAAYTINLWMDRRQQLLTQNTDLPIAPPDYHDMIALWAAILCLTKPSRPSDSKAGADYASIYAMRERQFITDYAAMQGEAADNPVIHGYGGY